MAETPHTPAQDGLAKGILDNHEIAAQNARLLRENEQLRGERDLLQMVMDSLPDPIYVKDRDSRFLASNVACARLLGAASPRELAGKMDGDYFPREFAERYFAAEQRLMQSGETLDLIEQTLDNASGQMRWMQTTKVPRRNAEGAVVGLIGIGRDITELKLAREAAGAELERRTAQLSQERLLLRTLIDNLPDCIYAKDAAGRKTLSNPADLKNFKCGTEAEALGKNDFDLFPREIAEKFWADDQKVIGGEAVINREEFFFDEAGRKSWLLTSKLPLRDQAGNIVGLVGIGRDITAQKEAEARLAYEQQLLQQLLEALPDSVFVKDRAGRFVLNNPAHARRRGCKSPSEMLGKTDFDYFPKEAAERFQADEERILETGEPLINQEQCVRLRDGSGDERWSAVSKVIWRDSQGKVLGTVGISRDIHEFKMAQEALRASEEKLREFAGQLERSNRELQDFAYVASHDLQEPLRKIIVFGERLREKAGDRLDAETLDYLQRMQKAAARMQNLINDLLSFSRVTTKAQPFSPVDLAQTARDVVDDLEGRIETTNGRVELGELPVIDAEPLQMRQLLQNLIGNALKFRRPEAQPVVKIAATIQVGAEGKPICELTVSDNGIGFDEKYLDRIFNVFQRLHSRNEYEGTGMGLAIARKIAIYHGGSITAKSAPGRGATFIVTLPSTHHKNHENGK